MPNQKAMLQEFSAFGDASSAMHQVISLQIALELSAVEMEPVDLVAAMSGIRSLTLMACDALEKMKNLEVRHV